MNNLKLNIVFGILMSLTSNRAFATVHCLEAAPEAVADRANNELLKKFGPGNRVSESQVIIGSYDSPYDFVAIVGAGDLGAFAYRVRTHFENDTVCVVDSVTPTSILVSKKIKDSKN
jgi:hypothetical protein